MLPSLQIRCVKTISRVGLERRAIASARRSDPCQEFISQSLAFGGTVNAFLLSHLQYDADSWCQCRVLSHFIKPKDLGYFKIMSTILCEQSDEIQDYVRDHMPAHVHIWKADRYARFIAWNNRAQLLDNHGLKNMR